MKFDTAENKELGITLHYSHSKKNERVFIATEVMKQLGYKGGTTALRNHDLIEHKDYVKVVKKDFPEFFKQLLDLKSIGHRAGSGKQKVY